VDIILRMNTNELIEALDAEIATLKQVKAILEGDGRTAAARRGRRTMSPEVRARMAAAQKAWWAKAKRLGKA
jgi:type II secretory pathway component PulJ